MKKSKFNNIIEKRLGGYKQIINRVDESKPNQLDKNVKVAVIGGGIAGLVSSAYLAERGFEVNLFEKENYLGGKIGSWKVKFDDGYTTNVEHGFHGFFKQYYNLRNYLHKIDAYKYLIPLEDYLIITKDHKHYRFKDISTVPILNIFDMIKRGFFPLSPFFKSTASFKMLDMVKYDPAKTFDKWDDVNFLQFALKAKLPKELQLIFESFARAFFAEPQLISVAELMKSFHFYFLSNDLGLIYDVLNDDFEKTFINPFLNFTKKKKFSYRTGINISSIDKVNGKFVVNGGLYDYLILASDIKGTKNIIQNSPYFKRNYPLFFDRVMKQKQSQKYSVLRIWTNKKHNGSYPFFIFTEALEMLDSITIYHEMEEESRRWAEQSEGGIYELHSYAVPDENLSESEVRENLLKEFYHFLPEMNDAEIFYEHMQLRDDFTAFHTGLNSTRMTYRTDVENLYFAGDWIKLECPAMLMEAAATSALFSINEIFKKEGLKQEKIYSVPLKGILA